MSAPAADPLANICALADEDWRVLSALMQNIRDLCLLEGALERDCSRCMDETLSHCMTLLMDQCARMLLLMLEHFEREQDIMAALPRSRQVLDHCARHREAHVEFTTRYNKTVATLDVRHVAQASAVLEAFVHDWMQRHAQEYDRQLALLRQAAAAAM